MKRIGLSVGLAFAAVLLFMAGHVNAQMGHGGGSGMMGRGTMDRGMGHGMMHQGSGPGWMSPERGAPYGNPNGTTSGRQGALEEKEARAILEDYLKSTRNPNLKLGSIEDEGEVYEAEILTRDDSLVDKVVVDKRSGAMRSVY